MKTDGNTDWFVKDRFGMFIHFGLYSSIARGEWVKFREHIKDEEYNRQLKYFDPDLYDPREWAKTAKAAGMKYAVALSCCTAALHLSVRSAAERRRFTSATATD